MTGVDLEVEHLYRADGWHSPGRISIDEHGRVAAVHLTEPVGWRPDERLPGFAVPGMPNLHSHGFQRGLAGRTEHREGRTADADNLWTWRQAMYRFVARIDPDDLAAITALAYLELVLGGFTSVGEFHYLHNDRMGARYADPAETSWSIAAAASEVGVGLTILPVLYRHAGPGRDPSPEQARFVLQPDSVVGIAAAIRARGHGLLAAGIAPHSLRAAEPAEIADLLDAWRADGGGPVHVHVAERPEEVEAVRAVHGAPPIQILVDRLGADASWFLVHATHGSPDELRSAAAAGATVVLCPVTEATVADGLFPLPAYVAAGGRWGIGTDSHYATEVAAELRMLELGQRLREGRRNPLVRETDGIRAHAGRVLFESALAPGRAGLAQPIGPLDVGDRADIVILDADAPVLAGHGPATVLDAWLLSGGASPVRHVMIGGRWVVRDGEHPARAGIVARYQATISRLAERD